MSKKEKLIYIYILLLPIMDLITSLTKDFASISINMIIKGLTILFLLIYIFFTKSKYKKISLIYIISLFIYVIAYFTTKIDAWSISFFENEIINGFKYLYFPLMLIGTLNLFDDLNIQNKKLKKVLLINLLTYSILLIIPWLTNTSHNSYGNDFAFAGIKGWFYSANEIGAILTILLVTMYELMDLKNKKKIFAILPILVSISLIGTKVSFIGMIGMSLLVLCHFIIKNKRKSFILSGTLFLFLIIAILFSPFKNNILIAIDVKNNNVIIENEETLTDPNKNTESNENIDNKENTENNENDENEVNDNNFNNMNSTSDKPIIDKYNSVDDIIKNKNIGIFVKVLFSDRETFFIKNYSIYEQSGFKNIMFGLGWSDRETINYTYYKKVIEIDFLDILIHYGIIGFILYFIPLILLFIKLLKNIKRITIEAALYILTFICALGISIFAGHIFSAPSVSIYLVFIIIIIKNEIEMKKNEK